MPSDRLNNLWFEHQKAAFPSECCGEECDGIDLVMLDADIAGCVTTFLKRKHTLDPCRLAVLGICYRDACYVASRLDPDAANYYQRLELLAKLVLEHVSKTTQLA